MYHKSFVSYFIVFFFILGIFFFQYKVFDSDLNVNFTRKFFENTKQVESILTHEHMEEIWENISKSEKNLTLPFYS